MERLLPFNDAIARLGISRATGYRLAAKGELNLRKIGKKTLIAESEIERFIKSTPVAPLAKTA